MKVNLYECDICGKQGDWDKNWSWYGSYKDMDDGKKVFCLCSQKCQNKFAEKFDGEKIRK
jgi:hypothetical protein